MRGIRRRERKKGRRGRRLDVTTPRFLAAPERLWDVTSRRAARARGVFEYVRRSWNLTLRTRLRVRFAGDADAAN